MTIDRILSGLTSSLAAVAAAPRVGTTAASKAKPAEPGTEAQEDRVELSPAARGEEELSDEEREQVEDLKQRDAEVRQHEAAHIAAAGAYARGGAHYEFQSGPDGQKYVVGGEVQIDTSPVPDDPDATIAKMQTVRAAALAPADPSGQDQRVAAQAAAEMQEAQVEKSQPATEETEQAGEPDQSAPADAEEPAGPPAESSESEEPGPPPTAAETKAYAAHKSAPDSSARLVDVRG